MNHTGRENRTDTPEQINNCLSCDKPDCDNCVQSGKQKKIKGKRAISEEEAKKEIEELQKSPFVKIGRRAERVKNQKNRKYNAQRQKLYTLRYLEKKGRQIAKESPAPDDDIF